MTDPVIRVRVIAELASEGDAEEEMRRVAALLEAHAPAEGHRVEEYPKFADSWALSLSLRPAASPHALYERVLALAPAGWTVGEVGEGEEDGERWAVWNAEPGVEFLTPRVKWAEVQLWDEGAQPAEPVEYEELD